MGAIKTIQIERQDSRSVSVSELLAMAPTEHHRQAVNIIVQLHGHPTVPVDCRLFDDGCFIIRDRHGGGACKDGTLGSFAESGPAALDEALFFARLVERKRHWRG